MGGEPTVKHQATVGINGKVRTGKSGNIGSDLLFSRSAMGVVHAIEIDQMLKSRIRYRTVDQHVFR
jgi:hypothetical protein